MGNPGPRFGSRFHPSWSGPTGSSWPPRGSASRRRDSSRHRASCTHQRKGCQDAPHSMWSPGFPFAVFAGDYAKAQRGSAAFATRENSTSTQCAAGGVIPSFLRITRNHPLHLVRFNSRHRCRCRCRSRNGRHDYWPSPSSVLRSRILRAATAPLSTSFAYSRMAIGRYS